MSFVLFRLVRQPLKSQKLIKGDGVIACEKTVIGNKHSKVIAILLNFILKLQVNYVLNFTNRGKLNTVHFT